MKFETIWKILSWAAFIVVVNFGVVAFLWCNYPDSWITQSLIFTKFKYIYQYPPGVYAEAEKNEHTLEFNELTIRFSQSSADELVHKQLLDSQMIIDANSYSFSQITPEVLQKNGAEDRSNPNYPNSSTWILERTLGINHGYHVFWGFTNGTIDIVGIRAQHPPDSAKGPAKPVPIQFSIAGSEWIQLPIKEKELVRILGKPEKITREPMFP